MCYSCKHFCLPGINYFFSKISFSDGPYFLHSVFSDNKTPGQDFILCQGYSVSLDKKFMRAANLESSELFLSDRFHYPCSAFEYSDVLPLLSYYFAPSAILLLFDQYFRSGVLLLIVSTFSAPPVHILKHHLKGIHKIIRLIGIVSPMTPLASPSSHFPCDAIKSISKRSGKYSLNSEYIISLVCIHTR